MKPDASVLKSFGVTLKGQADDKTRTIPFAITTYTVDRAGEVVIPKGGRFDEYMTNPVVLFGHNSRDLPVAACLEIEKSANDVMALTRFAGLDQLHPFAETVYRLYRDQFLKAVSVGFQPITVSQDKVLPGQTGITYVDWNLFEYSCVPIPSNPTALARMSKAFELPSGATEQDLLEAIFVKTKTWVQVIDELKPGPASEQAIPSEQLRVEAPMVIKGAWTTEYVNDLPDSSFAYIEPGGTKDDAGKTTPRSKRHLPYKDADGKLDADHVRNALSRLPQTDAVPANKKPAIKAKLEAALAALNQQKEATMQQIVTALISALRAQDAEAYAKAATAARSQQLVPPEYRAYSEPELTVLAALLTVPETVTEFQVAISKELQVRDGVTRTGFRRRPPETSYEGRKIHSETGLTLVTLKGPDADLSELFAVLAPPPTPGKDAASRLVTLAADDMAHVLVNTIKPTPVPVPAPLTDPTPTITQQAEALIARRAVSRAIQKAMGMMEDTDAQDEAEEAVTLGTMGVLIDQLGEQLTLLEGQHADLVALQGGDATGDLQDVKELAALQLFELTISQLRATLNTLCAQSCAWIMNEHAMDSGGPMASMTLPESVALVTKAGRVLSGKNLGKLKQAAVHIADVIGDHESRIPPKPDDTVGPPSTGIEKTTDAPPPEDKPGQGDHVPPEDMGPDGKPKPKKPKKPGDPPGEETKTLNIRDFTAALERKILETAAS